ncbi:hypothetical protein PFISCL1PPCAC_1015, partial [Pristionchus fissidentatus]
HAEYVLNRDTRRRSFWFVLANSGVACQLSRVMAHTMYPTRNSSAQVRVSDPMGWTLMEQVLSLLHGN